MFESEILQQLQQRKIGFVRVVSVNISKPEILQIRDKAVTTGIFKHLVSEKVSINAQGLVGDTIANTTHHGGTDQSS